MKIALLTIWHEKNYGAEMQAYATIKILKELGHDVEMIDFRLSDIHPKSIKRYVAQFISSLSIETCKFNKFWKRYIPTTRRYKSIDSIVKCPPKADLYLIGSDQVWNLDITKAAAAVYFLDFGNANIKRVSYASSFGISDFNDKTELNNLVRGNLHRFKAIGCREVSGVEFLKAKYNIDSTNVLDPTLLFNGYPELAGQTKEAKTLVFYPLSPYSELEKWCKDMAENLGLKYINTNNKTHLTRTIVWDRPSIEEWIRNIAESSLVITPSFHGLAFSLIYKRQFIIVSNGLNRSTRITSLLSQLGLEDRYFETLEDAKASNAWNRRIDYSTVDVRLSEMRNKSINFLKDIL